VSPRILGVPVSPPRSYPHSAGPGKSDGAGVSAGPWYHAISFTANGARVACEDGSPRFADVQGAPGT
jgi:hypothetical protein